MEDSVSLLVVGRRSPEAPACRLRTGASKRRDGSDLAWQTTWRGSSWPVNSIDFGDCDLHHNLLTNVKNRGYNAPQMVPASLRREAGVTHDVLRHDLSVRRFWHGRSGPCRLSY